MMLKATICTRAVRSVILAGLVSMPLGCGRAQGTETPDGQRTPALSAEEVRLARQAAEQRLSIPANPTDPLNRVYFIKVDLLPESPDDPGLRLVNVVHYRYRNDETVISTVALNSLDVLKAETVAHHPTGLALEEVTRAEALARANASLQGLFARAGLVVEARPLQAAPADPLFGHRVVHLLVREGADYLTSPRILVDLTTEAVLVE